MNQMISMTAKFIVIRQTWQTPAKLWLQSVYQSDWHSKHVYDQFFQNFTFFVSKINVSIYTHNKKSNMTAQNRLRTKFKKVCWSYRNSIPLEELLSNIYWRALFRYSSQRKFRVCIFVLMKSRRSSSRPTLDYLFEETESILHTSFEKNRLNFWEE